MNNVQKIWFLHSKATGTTIQIVKNDDGSMTHRYQQTLDPDEELPEDTYTLAESRQQWKEYIAKGYKKATYWHQCKRRSAWAD